MRCGRAASLWLSNTEPSAAIHSGVASLDRSLALLLSLSRARYLSLALALSRALSLARSLSRAPSLSVGGV